jgi:hypothetical protein
MRIAKNPVGLVEAIAETQYKECVDIMGFAIALPLLRVTAFSPYGFNQS